MQAQQVRRAAAPGSTLRRAGARRGSASGSQPETPSGRPGVEVLERRRRRARGTDAAPTATSNAPQPASIGRRAAHVRPRHARAAHLGDPHRPPLPSTPGVPGANAARRISIRKRFARSGAAAAPCRRGRPRAAASPPVADAAGPASGGGRRERRQRQRRRASPLAAPTPATRGRATATRRSTAARLPSKALEARKPGTSLEAGGGREARRARRRAGRARRRASSGTARPAVDLPRNARPAARYTRSRPLSASPRSRTSAAPAEPRSRPRAERVVARRALEQVGEACASRSAPASARSASTGGRSASVACTPGIRSSRMPRGGRVRPCSVDDPDAAAGRRPVSPTGSRFQPARTG